MPFFSVKLRDCSSIYWAEFSKTHSINAFSVQDASLGNQSRNRIETNKLSASKITRFPTYGSGKWLI